jgi:gluconate 5-dehydrogenase
MVRATLRTGAWPDEGDSEALDPPDWSSSFRDFGIEHTDIQKTDYRKRDSAAPMAAPCAMPHPFDLSGKIALVTGASRGLGQNFARTLARAGADLAITSRSRDSLAPFAKEIESLGRRVVCLALDVRQEESIRQAVAEAGRQLGRIDILVNNAGCNIRKPATDVTWEDWNTIVDTNLRGLFFVAQAVARLMIPRKYGRIINLGSVTCVAGYAGLGPYGASRGGVKQLTMSLAHDWGPHGITVNCLAPGWFKTDQNRALYDDPGWVEYLCERIPLGRPGSPGDLDGALLLLASDAGRYITGQTMLVDGGISVGAVRAMSRQERG